MDKRTLLAILLSVIALVGIQLLFANRQPAPTGASAAGAETTAVASRSGAAAAGTAPSGAAPAPAPAPAPSRLATVPVATGPGDTISVQMPLARYRFTTRGAVPLGVELHDYRSLAPGAGAAQVVDHATPLLGFRLLTGADTLPLDRLLFTVDSSALHAPAPVLSFRAMAGTATVLLRYTFAPDSYLVHVQGALEGVPATGAQLVVTLPHGFQSQETDTLDDAHSLAYVLKPRNEKPRNIPFAKLDTAASRLESGPFWWAAARDKYFLVALLSPDTTPAFSTAVLHGVPQPGKLPTLGRAVVATPLAPNGTFAFSLYTGPQEWNRMLALGHDFQNVNPYGGFFSGIVQPFATIVMRVLLWMHSRLQLTYGWVLIIFGVVVRVVLWPLNQNAMRSSLRMQRIQPELQALQKRYKDNPEKQQTEMMRLYKEHGMSPLSPVLGCLPMLIPMPVLFALYFVFQTTIAFRGVPFLWMIDISQRDPYYILPIVMGISMFVLSWIGLRSSPPNPQAKAMAYVLPLSFLFFLRNAPAGLNLYYAVQNIATLPQQWYIARERARAAPVPQRSTST